VTDPRETIISHEDLSAADLARHVRKACSELGASGREDCLSDEANPCSKTDLTHLAEWLGLLLGLAGNIAGELPADLRAVVKDSARAIQAQIAADSN
jgi:hypothetical protein